jgi:formylmethanofuran dehydrogenase subunit D
MLQIDKSWEFNSQRIIIEELDLDRLGWKNGDHFVVTNVNGRAMLVKVDPMIPFVKGYDVKKAP